MSLLDTVVGKYVIHMLVVNSLEDKLAESVKS